MYKLNRLTNIQPLPNIADIVRKGETSNNGKCEETSGTADIEMPDLTEKKEECNMGKKCDNDSAHHSGECQNSKPYRLIKILVV